MRARMSLSRSLFALVVVSFALGACKERDSGGPQGTAANDSTHGDTTTGDSTSVDPTGGDPTTSTDPGTPISAITDPGERLFRDYCIACHTIGGGPMRGPDLKDVQARRPQGWVGQWLRDPVWMAENDAIGIELRAAWPIQMPDPDLTQDEQRAVMQYIRAQSAIGPVPPRTPVALTDATLAATKATYFDRCAGCHGTYRAGATGPNIAHERARTLGTDVLFATIKHGTPSGMPNWGTAGVLNDVETDQMAAFLQLPAPEAPGLDLTEIRTSWQLHVPVDARPTAPEHGRDYENFFGVILRDPGKVALYDGTTHEELAMIDTGFAVHILRASSTGRYFYAVGRDGRVTLIDLWLATPAKVAEVQGCFDARSVEGSKVAGYEDRYLIEGCYWPPQYVVFDGLTLEPLQRVDVLTPTFDTNEPLAEVRVAAIAASHDDPVWLVALKESGHVAVVDYAQPDFPIVAKLPAARYLHDGGWDHSGRYFLLAANASNRMVVVDAQAREVVTTIETGVKPHPGRGANWQDPVYGWVNATPHIGEGKLAVYGTDPVQHPEHAWKVVREVALPSAGSLFLKTHENSPWVFVDMTMSADMSAARQLCVYAKEDGVLDHCWEPIDHGRVVHFELDRTGTELWVSVWDDDGVIVIYDSTTLIELDRITGLDTPTGKFNVYNTAHDIY